MDAILPPCLSRREQKLARPSTTFTFISYLGKPEISKIMMRYTLSLKNSIQSKLILTLIPTASLRNFRLWIDLALRQLQKGTRRRLTRISLMASSFRHYD